MNSFKSFIDVTHPQEARHSKSDLITFKFENKQLKLKTEKCLIEEERYRNMKHELELLTQKFSKVSNCHIQSNCLKCHIILFQ
jgi:hypothetical protein